MQLRHYLLILFCIFSFRISAQSTASQQVVTFTINAPQLHTQKKIWVYLPLFYEKSQKAYSVIYMHDAQNLFDSITSYVGEWKIDEYLDSISNNEAIIIGIEHGNENRINELTPYENEKYGGGKGDLYLDFIINNLKPHIDHIYRTLSDAEHTTIFGSSLGGLISFYAATKYPNTFGNVGVFSPSFWINPEIFTFVETLTLAESTRFYFLVGTKEGEGMVPDQEKMVSLLKGKGVTSQNIVNKIIDGGQHNESFWSDSFPEAFQWFMKKQ